MPDFRTQIMTLVDSLTEAETITDGQRISLLNATMRIGNGEFISTTSEVIDDEDDEELIYKLHLHTTKMKYTRIDNQVIIDPENIDFDYYTPLSVSEYDLIRDTIYHDGYFEFNIHSDECDWFLAGDLLSENKEIHTILPNDDFHKGIVFQQNRQLIRVYHVNLHTS